MANEKNDLQNKTSNAYKWALKNDFPDTPSRLNTAFDSAAREYTELSKTMDSIDNGPKVRNTGDDTLVADISRGLVQRYRQELKAINQQRIEGSLKKTEAEAQKELIYKKLESIQKANSPVKGKDLRQQAIAELSDAGELDSKTWLNLSKMAKENPRKLIVGVLTTAMLGALFPPALPFIFLGVAAVVAVKALEYLSNWWTRESKIQKKVDEIADEVQVKNAQNIKTEAGTPLLEEAETDLKNARQELAEAQAKEKAIHAEIKNDGSLNAIKEIEARCRSAIASLEVKLIEAKLTVPQKTTVINAIDQELSDKKSVLLAADNLRKEVMQQKFDTRITEVQSKITQAEPRVEEAKKEVTHIKTTYGISSTQKPTAPSPSHLGPTARSPGTGTREKPKGTSAGNETTEQNPRRGGTPSF